MYLVYQNKSIYFLISLLILLIAACAQDASTIRPALSYDLQRQLPSIDFGSVNIFDPSSILRFNRHHTLETDDETVVQGAFLLLQRGDIEAARRLFSEVLLRNPQNSLAMSGLGAIELIQNRPTDALRLANQALSINRSNFFAESVAGFSFLALDENDKAKQHFERAKQIHPGNEDAEVGLSVIDVKEKRYNVATDKLSNIIRKNPNNKLAILIRGFAFFYSMNFASAETDFRNVFSVSPNDLLVVTALGTIHFLQGIFKRFRLNIRNIAIRDAEEDFNLAEFYFSRAIDMKSDDVTLYRLRAQVRRHLGNFAGAISDLSTAILVMPKDPKLYTERARIFREIGRLEDAERDVERARSLGVRGSQ